MYKTILHIVVLYFISKTIVCHQEKKDDKLVLTPVELVDLVRKEQFKNKEAEMKPMMVESLYDSGHIEDMSSTEPDQVCEDEVTLKNRKVWSRWSKWGECSVTCGSGSISRFRVCVAGRCAPGEREEQRRPCARSPCYTMEANVTDDLHDVE